jgi:hypothetical protein
MDEHPPDNTLRLAAPKARQLSPAMEREAVGLLAALLLDAASRRAGDDRQNVVPIRPPLAGPIGGQLPLRLSKEDPSRQETPAKRADRRPKPNPDNRGGS